MTADKRRADDQTNPGIEREDRPFQTRLRSTFDARRKSSDGGGEERRNDEATSRKVAGRSPIVPAKSVLALSWQP